MPDRILRAELLTSEAWLTCKSNDDRVCWIALIPTVDTLGNLPAGPYRLINLWRPYGIETPEKVAKVLAELVDVDLVRTYFHPLGPDGAVLQSSKPYLHVPRFLQSRRYLGRLWPLSPWTTPEDLQRVREKSRADHSGSHTVSCEPPVGVGVGVGVGIEKSASRTPTRVAKAVPDAEKIAEIAISKTENPKAQPHPAGQQWDNQGWVVQTALTFGINPRTGEDFPAFRDRVYTAVQQARNAQRGVA